jgi:hypothetical protein
VTAALLLALAADFVLIALAASPYGFSRVIGPLHIRLHDPSTPLLIAALLSGSVIAAYWRTRARGWSLALIPLVATLGAVVVTRHAVEMFPLGDIAVIELYVRDAVAGRLLVGPYSRFGWHHPGPLYFYVIAPFYAFGHSATASLAAGAACIAMSALALFTWAAARTIGARSSVVLLAAVLFYLWRVPGLSVSAWNPHVVVIPAAALVVLSAGAAGGDVMLLPVAAVLASLIAQTDVALVPFAGALTLAALIAAVMAARRWKSRTAMRSINVSAWMALALWLVPIAEELTHSPGNMTLLWRFFAGAHGHGQTLSDASAAWAAMLTAPFSGAFSLAGGATFEANAQSLRVAIALTELAALALVARRQWTGDRALARLALFSLGASLVALWSVTRIEERIFDHEIFWISALGALNAGIVAAAAISSLSAFARPSPVVYRLSSNSLLHGALLAAAVAICLSQADRAREGRLPATATSPVVERLAGSVRQYLEGEGAHKPLVRIGQDSWGMAAGVLLETDRSGIPFAVEDSWKPMFPPSLAPNGQEDAEIAFGNGDEHLQRTSIPGSELIASFPPLYVDGLPHTAR